MAVEKRNIFLTQTVETMPYTSDTVQGHPQSGNTSAVQHRPNHVATER